jgi:hypothetical protein
LGARTETEKTGIFTKQKSESVARTTVELFCEGKSPGFYVESRDPTGEFGLVRAALGWQVVIHRWSPPLWISWAAAVLFGALGLAAFY